jgi:hypothetical protein
MQLHITKVLVTLKIGIQRTNIKRQKKRDKYRDRQQILRDIK